MADEFLTVAEVAKRLKVNEQTVRNWIDAGTLPAVRAGERRVRVRARDLEAFLEPAAPAVAADGRAALASALARTQDAQTDAELAAALRELARAAGDLAEALAD